MFDKYAYTAAERFMRYVQIDTQSDPESNTHPTTEKQKNLGKVLADELRTMGLADAHLDEFGYVYATIPSNTDKAVPVICFCSHVDTTSDCSGANVKPILHQNYQGQAIVLPDDPSMILTTEDFPYLKKHIGTDVITASGLTLLGADDKAGVAIIMDLANYLLQHPQVKHGAIKILFTPDEEVGKGTAKLDMQKLGAQYGYTLDGGEAGTMEDETFSADAAILTIHGVIAHPGDAKGKMVNALKIAGEILAALPGNEFCPEATEGRQGFVHPVAVSGSAETASIQFIVRDFDNDLLAQHSVRLQQIAASVLAKHPKAKLEMQVKEQYRNMRLVLDKHPDVVQHAEEAIQRAGLVVEKMPIRGGTDGSRLSYMGMPCPNIFTGMQNIHSKKEWIGVKDMELALQTLVHLVQIWEERS
jgi:tripeptide aminopeptidase